MKIGIIGNGTIANELKFQLEHDGVCVAFIYHHTSQEVYEVVLREHRPVAMFLAISTKDTGEAARDYIRITAQHGIPIITCEKGAYAYHASTLREYAHLVGVSATVGGGSMILPYTLLRHVHRRPVDIQAILNGTINFIFYKLQKGSTFGEACIQAINNRLVEPGATEPLNIVNSELKDVALKICVFYNLALAKKSTLTPQQLGGLALSEEELYTLIHHKKPLRLIVAFSNMHKASTLVNIKKTLLFNVKEDWTIRVSFQEVDGSESWLPVEAGNTIHISEGPTGEYGEYVVSGPGAGPKPTARAMINDFDRLVMR